MSRTPWRRLAALALVAPLLVTGCQTRVGVAALVGSARITETQLQDATADGLRAPAVRKVAGGQPALYRQAVLSRLIQHELLTGAGRKLGVRTTEGALQKAMSELVAQYQGKAQLEQNYAQNLAIAPDQIEGAVRDLVMFRAIGATLSENLTFSDADLKQAFDQRSADQASLTFEQYKPTALEQVKQRAASAAASKYLASYVGKLKVSVNPRYGRFNASSVSVVPETDKLVRDSTAAPAQSPAPGS